MNTRLAWKFALVPTIVMVVVALYPQISLWVSRGSAWEGSYAAVNYDEVAYSAYINGLISGKPRKYDPMMGVEHEHESIYSLQFIPAYAIAAPARVLGISTLTTYIILQIFIAIFCSLGVFYLLRKVTGENIVAAAGVLIVLCLGTAITYEGALSELTGGSLVIEFHPFLRRYQPGLMFPLFFLMCAAVWAAFISEGTKRITASVTAGILFAVLVFSYFYLWTTAAAWLACFFGAALVVSRTGKKTILFSAVTIAAIAVAALIPYFLMLNQRSRKSDASQLLALTHAPDLTAPTVVIGLITIVLAVLLGLKAKIDARSPAAIFSYAFLLTPFAVMNQQILTGRSLQPVHYEIFIANYCLLTGIVIVIWLAIRGVKTESPETVPVSGPNKAFVYLGIAAALWGFYEASHATARNAGMSFVRDVVTPAAKYIRDSSAGSTEPIVVHSPNAITASYIPTIVTGRILWSPHLISGGVVSEEESKQQFYRFLYFSGFTHEELKSALDTRWFEVTAAIFGGGRALPQLGGINHPITNDEIAEEVAKYRVFTENLTFADAHTPNLTHMIVLNDEPTNMANIDRWYTRDAGHVAGLFRVYKLTPKAR
jgi:hypothetical protein